jgi:hypothetical protein
MSNSLWQFEDQIKKLGDDMLEREKRILNDISHNNLEIEKLQMRVSAWNSVWLMFVGAWLLSEGIRAWLTK